MSTRLSTGKVRRIYEFIRANQHLDSVETMYRLLEVARSGYYAWLQEPVSRRAQEDARLLRLIRASFDASHGIYGAPRVFLDLREAAGAPSNGTRNWSMNWRRSRSIFRISADEDAD